jgi:hypothetical protein
MRVVEATLPVKTELRLQSLHAMVASEHRSLVEGILGAAFHLPIRAAPRETLDLGLPDRMMATLCVAIPLGGIVLGTSAG